MRARKGITLIEILVVIVIVGILTALIVVAIQRAAKPQHERRARTT